MRLSSTLITFALFLIALVAMVGYSQILTIQELRTSYAELREAALVNETTAALDRDMIMLQLAAREYFVSDRVSAPPAVDKNRQALLRTLAAASQELPKQRRELGQMKLALEEYSREIETLQRMREDRRENQARLLSFGASMQKPLEQAVREAYRRDDASGGARGQAVQLRLREAQNEALSALLAHRLEEAAQATRGFSELADELSRLEALFRDTTCCRHLARQTREALPRYVELFSRVLEDERGEHKRVQEVIVPRGDALQARIHALGLSVSAINRAAIVRFDQALAEVRTRALLFVSGGITIAIVGTALLLWISIVPLSRLTRAMTAIARGAEALDIPYRNATNEIGAMARALAVFRDALADQRKARADAEAMAAQERELNGLKTRFVAMASHEFRTPLASILSSAEILDHYGDKLDAKEKHDLATEIGVAVKRMQALLEDVLTFGKSEAGRLDFEPRPTDLLDLAQKVMNESLMATDGRQVIDLTHTPEAPEAFCGLPLDGNLLRHVLANLLTNACKYSKDAGHVGLHLARNGPTLAIRVRDQGIGIPAADLPRLFEPFHRATNVGTIPGTGLGLVIAKRAIDLHGGRIDVDSRVGEGTTITVTIPLSGPAHSP
jgi:signal transduction histidine kinase